MNKITMKIYLSILFVFVLVQLVAAQTTSFTYQGRFTDSTVAQPTNGSYNMQFRLFDTDGVVSAGTQSGTTQSALVSVVNGIFTVKLNFGAAAFATTQPRFLEIQVGANVLTPRQEITSTPFSNRAASAANADALSSNCVLCVTNAQINSVAGSKITGTVNTAANFSANLGGDVTGTQNDTVVSEVGGQTAANIAAATTAVRNATNANNANTLVRRDSAGNFIAGQVTATTFNGNLNGNAMTAGSISGVVAVANGGTGSTTQNFVDLTTNQSIDGTKTFNGRLNGGAVDNLLRVYSFAGGIDSIAGNSLNYVFAGPFATVTITAGQRITGAATAPLGRTIANDGGIQIGLCYRLTTPVINFAGVSFSVVQIGTLRQTYSASASVAGLAPGTYNVGFCVLNNSSGAINNNDSVNGSISSLDAAYIAQFIVGIPNPSITGTWKFLPTSRSYPNVLTSQTNQDYSAILVGDVTGNWNPSGMLQSELSDSEGGLTRQIDKTKQMVAVTAQTNESAGEETALTLNLTAGETTGEGILGYQFDLFHDAAVIGPQAIGCDVSDTISRELTAICHVSESGVLKVVVFGATPISGGGTLLRLNFKVVGARDSTSRLTIRNFMFNEDSQQKVTVLTK